MNKKFLLIISTIFIATLLFGCTQNNTTNTPSTQTQTNQNPGQPNFTPQPQSDVSISIQNFSFDPKTITIAKGTKITWTNNDSMTHTITENKGSFDSGNVAANATYSFTFNTAGTYNYHCNIHPSMKATIIVQ